MVVVPVIMRVCLQLQQTEVNGNHYCRQTASSIRTAIDSLNRIIDSSPVALSSSSVAPLPAESELPQTVT